MINLFYQDLQYKYFKKAKSFFRKDLWVNGEIIKKFERNFERF